MKFDKKVFLTILKSTLIILFLAYFVFSSSLLYLAIYNEYEWNIFKTEVLESKIGKLASQNIVDIIKGNVKLTIPKEFISLMGEDYDYTLTEEEKANGFTDVKKKADGSAEFTIKKEKYEIFIKELKKSTVKSIKETIASISEQGNASIKNIKYRSDLGQISVYVDKPQFNEVFDALYINTVGLTACMYRMFDINCNGECIIDLIDTNTNKVYETIICPDDIFQ